MVDRITGPIEIVNATLSGANTYLPSGAVNNTAFSSNSADRLDATKANHQKHVHYFSRTDESTDTVFAVEEVFHVAQGAGTIVACYVSNESTPTGGDLSYTCDVKKASNGSGTYATILSGTISPPADNTVGSGTLSTTTYSQYDRFQVDINTSGSTGTNGIGVVVTLILNEAPA